MSEAPTPSDQPTRDRIVSDFGRNFLVEAGAGSGKTYSLAMRMAAGLRFGTVWVNDHIPIISEMPHGGFKHSGYGKDMSIYAVEAYTELKHVMVKH